jgi:hypothetical protein
LKIIFLTYSLLSLHSSPPDLFLKEFVIIINGTILKIFYAISHINFKLKYISKSTPELAVDYT